nr:hypothetical protein [uncultured Draconibacterium sp.]
MIYFLFYLNSGGNEKFEPEMSRNAVVRHFRVVFGISGPFVVFPGGVKAFPCGWKAFPDGFWFFRVVAAKTGWFLTVSFWFLA